MDGNEHDPTDEAVREAAAWFARLRGGEPTEPTRRAFRAWLAADARNHEAFRNLKSLWYTLDEPAQLAGYDRWYRKGLGAGRRARRMKTLTAVAASLACVFCLVLWSNEGIVDRTFADYATAPGERRTVALADGSHLLLDGDSALDLALSESERNVRLIRGRVWFDVARDESRPFTVTSGAVKTRVLGTAFAVDNETDTIDVTVEHGLVAVSTPGGGRVELTAGESVSFANSRLEDKEAADLDISLAWRRGLLVMNHTPLDKVARELSRMSSGRVILRRSDSYPAPRLSGVFRVDDPDAIITALRAANINAVRIPGVATIIY